MNLEDRNALIRYRMGNAWDTLKQAETLYDGRHFLGVVNRAYYAIFYATLAILLTKSLGSSKHKGVISLFDKYFVKEGEVDVPWSKMLHKSFERRRSGDYDDWATVDEKEAKELLDNAQEFVQWAQNWLTERKYLRDNSTQLKRD